jgi:HEPN domain-containing protein
MNKSKHLADIRDFLKKAEDGLKYVEWDLKGGLYTPVCFWSQQVGEKALKAALIFYRGEYLKTHFLEKDLLEEISRYDSSFGEIRNYCQILDQYYVPTRYPAPSAPEGEFTKDQALEAKSCAEKILEFVKKKILVP